jgi:hypothetical protein
MSLRAPRQPFVLIRKPLDNFRPRNVRSEFGPGENTEGRDPSDQVPKSDSTNRRSKLRWGVVSIRIRRRGRFQANCSRVPLLEHANDFNACLKRLKRMTTDYV